MSVPVFAVPDRPAYPAEADDGLGIVLTGGGARAAYQVGVLSGLAELYPDLRIPYLTGFSAGAVNIAHLASHHGTLKQATDELCGLWGGLEPEKIYRVDPPSLGWIGGRVLVQLISGGRSVGPDVRALLDTAPLREFLEEALAAVHGRITGVDANLASNRLCAAALTTTSYTTGETVVWVQGGSVEPWQRPQRVSRPAEFTVDHVMASSALPFFFPAVQLADGWYGDGQVRLIAPISPALHLGATRVLAISTRAERDAGSRPKVIDGYPPPAQIAGVMLNAIFLDMLDQDALRMERLNNLLAKLPPEERGGMRLIRLLVIRPSKDLAKLANAYEPRMPRTIRWLVRGLGSKRTRSPDVLSMLMFQSDYLKRIIDLGREDARAHAEEIAALVEETP
ncbi:MAG TPA: patatin-like phospholipase family protein [Longimicrobiales bacterium]|nr:patatin-like phospholipase family protein [Longimicrobiales bacterium]